jgi:hypothetical protein
MSLFWDSGKYDEEMEEADKAIGEREANKMGLYNIGDQDYKDNYKAETRRIQEGQSVEDYKKNFWKEKMVKCENAADAMTKFAESSFIPPFKRADIVKRAKTSERASYEFRSIVLECFLKSDNKTWLVACESFAEPGLVHIFNPSDLEIIKL